ncbi:PTS sugar transporter subunit IIB [Microbacterium sp. R86528]|uniref:PTS sugar transporter subunit IIB n=1 Tax=Microbacterium sp. R86528 TaxID=3093864 RepID=UPI0037CBB83A
MKILVVCGAGASSTFVAQRLRHAAQDHGFAWTASAGTEQSLPIDLDAADVVLVGNHLASVLEHIRRAAESRGTTVVLLPTDIYTDHDGTRTLQLVRDAVGVSQEVTPTASTAAPEPISSLE